jgi:hypothetical protein
LRKRVLASVAFAILGLMAAVPISDSFGFPLPLAFVGCGLAGTGIGYFISVLLDVFVSGSGEVES